MKRRIRLGLGLAAIALLVSSGSASAATIQVNFLGDEIENNAQCALREAVQAANDNAPFGGCNGDTAGADTIVLQGGQTYPLTRHALPDDTNTNGDLDIASQVTIQSNGAGLATIDGDSTTFPPGIPLSDRDRVIDVLPAAGAVTLIRLRIQAGLDNATFGGGGIRTRSALTVIDSEVIGNVASVPESPPGGLRAGGGILVRDSATSQGSLTLSGSTIAGNSTSETDDSDAAEGGGIFHQATGPFIATNSTISGNTAVDLAGDGVNASRGAGITSFAGTGQVVTLTNVTVTNNEVKGDAADEGQGGGVFLLGPFTIGGTIVGANTAPSNPDCGGIGPPTLTSAGGNLVSDPTGCTFTPGANDLTGVLPNLGNLLPNGGPTRTHNLNPASPAIDRGGNCPATDQRGFFRAPVAPCDAGAFEAGAPATLPIQPPPDGGPGGDTTPPEATITNGPKDKTKKKTATFEFSSSEPGSTFQCQLDGKETFKPCTSPTTIKVKKGKHSFTVVATDASGNADATPASDSWKVKRRK